MGFAKTLEEITGNAGRTKGTGFALINGNPLGVARAIVAEIHPSLGFIDDVVGAVEGIHSSHTAPTPGEQAIGMAETLQSTAGAVGLVNPGAGALAAAASPGIMAAKNIERVKKYHPEYREQDVSQYRQAIGRQAPATVSLADQLNANREQGRRSAPYQ